MISLPDFKEKQILFIYADWHCENSLRLRNDNIIFLKNDHVENQISCHKLFAIFICGDMMLSSTLIKQAVNYGVSFFLMKNNFEVYASFASSADGNYLLRTRQYKMSKKEELIIAKNIIINKIDNQARLLKSRRLLISLKEHKQKTEKLVRNASKYKELLGIEGNFSKDFFPKYFSGLNWWKRMPRTKCDVNNLLLDMGYTFLFNFMDSLLLAYGFDTYRGCYHKLYFQRKSLTCDMVEPFRCLIERAILRGFNLKQIKKKDFKLRNGRYFLDIAKYKNYASIFMKELMNNKEEIFIFVQKFYRYIMNSSKYDFPYFRIKIK